jgi:hypothetical protein
MQVKDGRIFRADFVSGAIRPPWTEHNAKLKRDPVTGELGELGLGTQELPVSGSDIQDEKILGTFHVATGRSDHLGGHLTPDMFAEKTERHPRRHPVCAAQGARRSRRAKCACIRDGTSTVIIKDFQPSEYVTRPAGGRAGQSVNHAETYYESDDALAQYLWLHYVGTGDQRAVPGALRHAHPGPRAVCQRVRARWTWAARWGAPPSSWRAGATRWWAVDYSQRFMAAARQLQAGNSLWTLTWWSRANLKERFTARAPEGVARDRVRFETGDAQALAGRRWGPSTWC